MHDIEKTEGQILSEKLTYSVPNAGEKLSDAELKVADDFCEGYKDFLNAAKTEREAVDASIALAEAKGYKEYKIGDKISAEEKATIQAEIDKVKDVLKTEDTEKIKSATEELEKKFGEIATKMYQQAQPEGTPDNGAGQSAGNDDGNTFDAEYTVDDNN